MIGSFTPQHYITRLLLYCFHTFSSRFYLPSHHLAHPLRSSANHSSMTASSRAQFTSSCTLESVALSAIANQIAVHRVPAAVGEGVGKLSSRPRSRVIGKHAPRLNIAGNARSVGESDSACAVCFFCVVPPKGCSRSRCTSGARLPGEYVF